MKNFTLTCLILLAWTAAASSQTAGFDHDYTAATGDLNGDGLLDVYLEPKPNLVMIPLDDLLVPVSRRPEVVPFLLQRQSDNTFQIITNLTGVQRGALSQWQTAAAIIVETVDTNMDGVLDVLVSGIPSADPLIVFASAQSYAAPQAVKALTAQVRQFLSDVHNWTMDPARIVEEEEYGLWSLYELWLLGYLVNGMPITGNLFDPQTVPDVCTAGCQYDPTLGWLIWGTIHYNVLEFQTTFASQAAEDLANAFDPTLQDTSVTAQSPEATTVANVLEQTFGVEVMEGVLREGGVLEHESSADPEIEESRGFEILSEIAALAAALTTDSSKCRLLTGGEKSDLALGNGLHIRNIDRVRICNRGFLGLRSQIMAPNGHIYVGPNNGFLGWQADYSAAHVPIQWDRSIIVHEMFHVYQNRNRGCRATNGCILLLRLISLGNYCYIPLDPGKSFWGHNLEQEAELVADRYLLRNGLLQREVCNRPGTLPPLEQLIPALRHELQVIIRQQRVSGSHCGSVMRSCGL